MDLMRAGNVPASSSRTESKRPGGARASRLQGAFGGATVALSAAAGLLVGLRSVVALGAAGVRPLLSLPPIPREGMGITWTPAVVWPAQLQHVALVRMAAVILGLFLAAAAVAVLNALVLLAEAGASRRREVAVRSALGAPPGTLLGVFLADVGWLLALSLVLGLLLGLTAGGALRGLWPGELARLGGVGAAGTLAVGFLCVAGIAAVAYMWVGLTLGRSRRLSADLGAGERATDDAPAIFRRRALSAVQMGAAGSVALGAFALAMAVRAPGDATSPVTTTVIRVTAPAPHDAGSPDTGDVTGRGDAWQALLARLARIPGIEAESLATPGTLVGLGVRDHAIAQCGRCFIGQLPMPLWSVVADHYAVGPGYFSLAGRRLVSGRGFAQADGPSTKKVAVINESFARTAFENGKPLGRLVHLADESGPWYEVVGVVRDAAPAAVGRDDLPRPEIWVDALQQPPRHAEVLLRATAPAQRTAAALLSSSGYAPEPASGGAGPRSPDTGSWRGLLAHLAAVPGIRAESVSTAGALVGLGVRDQALAQCGACTLPLVPAVVDHYAVAPGYFQLTGRRVVAGRSFSSADGPSAKRVALVNETFARKSFAGGHPLGHLVRLGSDLDAWFEVVGVVADAAPPVMGRDDLSPDEVYVSALQQPLRYADVLLRDDPGAVDAAVALLQRAGYAPGEARTLRDVLRAAAAPLAWTRWVALTLALLTLLLAVHGAHATALQVSRRRLRELAVRRVLGATDARILLFVLGGSARGALWGSAVAAFFGSLLVAFLQEAAGGIPSPGPGAYLTMVALLVAASVLASLKAAREAVAVEPAEAVA
jgi:cell division protein FtsX